MEESRRVDRSQCRADVYSYPRRFVGRHWSSASNLTGQRLAADELHPNPDMPPDPFCTIHTEHVWMADARQQSAFFYDWRARRIRSAFSDKFERNFSIETGIPGSVDVAK
jgi:hypothetical protein